MTDFFRELFSYDFIIRAVIAGSLVSVCAALLGVSLVLKRFSMIGDGLSHVGFGALAIAMACNMQPLAVSIPVTLAAAFFLLRAGSSSAIKGDASVALISSGALAAGIIAASVSSGLNTDITAYMFGSILAVNKTDVYICTAVSAAVLISFVLFYNRIFSATFDETFAKAGGIHTELYNMLIASLTAMTVVVGIRLMGAMMISSLIVFPALSAMRICRSFFAVTVCSAVLSLCCFFAGIAVSFLFSTPAGATIVSVQLLVFCICALIGKLTK
ncbi:MAG: metal ABC transporter permease [Bacteroides sp.]|nr:metal ABC transporter permease [Prevotella sp.]MCM1407979.1 metal ABC transporter permease [Treponema brennaborense]MCM1468955.1 metal ABC transporter permease [Bacteroides sp.]